MTKHFIKQDQFQSILAAESGSEIILKKGVTLAGSPAIRNWGYDDVTYTILGKILTGGHGLYSGLNPSNGTGTGTSVDIAKSGRVLTDADGIRFVGNGAEIDNDGVVRSKESRAVYVADGGDFSLSNHGKMISKVTEAVLIEKNTGFEIRNDGLISTANDDVSAIRIASSGEGTIVNGAKGVIDGAVSFNLSTGDVRFTNKGEVKGGDISKISTISAGEGDDTIINRGKITGVVWLDDGDDTIDFRGGKLINGSLQGGDGGNTYFISKANTAVWELDGKGADTIKTTVSYVLGNAQNDDIEILTAIGKKAVNLTGNDQSNIVNGNAAANRLSGGEGNDSLLGFGGNDMLTGGGGEDHFFFYKKGGVDKITDFTANVDKIHILQIPGIGDFDDLLANMKMVDTDGDGFKDDDTIIDLGDGDRIRLVDVNKDALDMNDFAISG